MSSELHSFHAELIARDEDALWNWPRRSAAVMAEELANMCEQLAALLNDRHEAAPASDPIERAKLNYMYGSTLLTLAERHKPSLLPHAVERLGDALSLARRHVPERVVTIKSQLYRAEHSLAMLKTSTAPEEHAA
ncbi:MAG TPA: hypothetical protein VMK32_13200 [Burkholderiaceae bacterium]|nr:hypothetical protein [Burkholderiaceae bacterium]